MREGILVYDHNAERYNVRFGLEEYSNGLHCGDCLDVKIEGDWVPTRIELRWPDEWYLVGVSAGSLNGLKVRIR